MSRHFIKVAVGIVIQAAKVLVAQRPLPAPHGGLWEFPGGKFEVNETPFMALQRELKEEMGIRVQTAEPWWHLTHQYRPDYGVALHVWRILHYDGVPRGCEGQTITWADATQLAELPFLAGNRWVIEKLIELLSLDDNR